MPYRSAETIAPIRIGYGPFPARWKRLGFALLVLVVTVPLAIGAGSERSLRCERHRDEAQCRLIESRPFLGRSVEAFSASAIVEVETRERRARNGTVYDVVFLDRSGAERPLRTFDEREDAERTRREMAAFLRGGGRDGIAITDDPSIAGWAMVVGFLAIAIALTVNAFWGAGRFRVVVDRGKNTLTFTRKIFGIPIGRADLHASEVREVDVEHGEVRDWLRTRWERPENGGRIALRTHDGMQVQLSDRFLRGRDVHERAARDLRAALDLDAKEPAARTSSPEARAPLARPLVAIATLIVAGAAGSLVFRHVASQNQGTLELRAEQRCRFQGMEILPGGEMSIGLDPGPYSIEVWSPDAEDHWEPREVLLVKDETTTFVCRAR